MTRREKAQQLLDELRSRGGFAYFRSGTIRFRAPEGSVDQAFQAKLTAWSKPIADAMMAELLEPERIPMHEDSHCG